MSTATIRQQFDVLREKRRLNEIEARDIANELKQLQKECPHPHRMDTADPIDLDVVCLDCGSYLYELPATVPHNAETLTQLGL